MEEAWLNTNFWQKVIEDSVAWLIQTAPAVLVILVLAVVGLKAINFALQKLKVILIQRTEESKDSSVTELEKRIDTLVMILSKIIRVAVWTMVGMILLKKLGVDIAPLIAGAGIIGVAVGFGSQELVRDFITGFFMLLENQIRTGDVAIINGTGGLVENIGLRTITLRDLSGVVHIFQNGKINTLSNMTKEWSAMVFDVGIAYKEDTDKANEVMREVSEDLRSDPNFAHLILEPMELFGVDSFGDSAVILKGRIKTKPIHQWAVGREYNRRLKKAFDTKGIEIPFPHRTLYWGDEKPTFKVETAGKE